MTPVPDAVPGERRPGRLALWATSGLGPRVFVAVLVVLILEAVVLGVVAVVVGPHRYVDLMGGTTDPAARHTASVAFNSTIWIALSVALVVAGLVGAGAAWFIAGRLARPLEKFSAVAQAVSAGDYSARVERSGLGPQFDNVERAFNEMTQRLEATEEARGQLIADLSHEMRTPLMTLTTYLEALEDGVRPPLATTWEVMTDQVRRLGRLANDMSVASADQEGALRVERQHCDLAGLVALAAQAGRDGPLGSLVQIETRISPAPLLADVDPGRIEQVLTNLIDNACRHARGATCVWVIARQEPGRAVLIVEDDGGGVAPEDQRRIFDRFYRADRSRTGTGAGLGLAISRSIVQAHGGLLTYDDRPGGGARFTVSLPV